MEIIITTRGAAIPDAVRVHTEEKLKRVERFETRPATTHVSFSGDGAAKAAEVRITVAGGGVHIAHGAASNFRSALDQAVDRLLRQLKRDRERLTDHHAEKPLPS
jgi:putative sigma-54 modulation protein